MRRRRFLPRRLLPSHVGFWFSGPCLVVAVLFEAIYNLLRALFFPLQRRSTRERMHRLILAGGSSPRLAEERAKGVFLALFLAGAVVLLGAGCTTFPGASFEKQVKELNWSTTNLFLSESPADNLADIGGDLKTIFLGRSYEDLKLHELVHTFEMLGW